MMKETALTEQEILNGNSLIALFMGGEFRNDLTYAYIKSGWLNTPANSSQCIVQTHQFKYHRLYEWLMPVVEKMYVIGYDVEINSGLRRINICRTDTGLMDGSPDYNEELRGNKSNYERYSNVECLWLAVVDFIKWYNDVNKK